MRSQQWWRDLWTKGETPWIGPTGNDVLLAELPELEKEGRLHSGHHALVPLCGDSPAVRFLYDAGYSVTALEYVPEALERLRTQSFSDITFEERALDGSSSVWQAERIRVIRADFFSFDEWEAFDFIYDRAAYVALDDRAMFGHHVARLLRSGGTLLSRTAEMLGAHWIGPPHSVSFDEVTRNFGGLKLLRYAFDSTVPTQERFVSVGITEIKHLTCIFGKDR